MLPEFGEPATKKHLISEPYSTDRVGRVLVLPRNPCVTCFRALEGKLCVCDLGFRVWGFRVSGSGCWVEGVVFMDLGCRVVS